MIKEKTNKICDFYKIKINRFILFFLSFLLKTKDFFFLNDGKLMMMMMRTGLSFFLDEKHTKTEKKVIT